MATMLTNTTKGLCACGHPFGDHDGRKLGTLECTHILDRDSETGFTAYCQCEAWRPTGQYPQLKPTTPPLSQSAHEMLSCPHSYVHQVIRGHKNPESIDSDRGHQVHAIMSDYIDYCVKSRVPADWAHFDRLTAAAGPEAGDIFDNGIRLNYEVPWDNVIGTEMALCLTEDFVPMPRSKHRTTYHASAAYAGTLDVVIADSDTHATIDDFKSHPRPFEPDTMQARLYPFLLFIHFPNLEEIEFRLRFVRYPHATRSIVWKREQMPTLLADIERARKRQLALHASVEAVLIADVDRINVESSQFAPGSIVPISAINPGEVLVTINGETPKALPSKQCCYCPLLANGCPVPEEVNPYERPTMEERVRLAVYLDQARTKNNAVLKEWVDFEGKGIEYRTGNGELYMYGPKSTESRTFNAIKTLAILGEWVTATGDGDFVQKLTLSSSKLKPYLKAKKRASLDQRVQDQCQDVTTRVTTKLHKPEGDESDEVNDYGEGI